MMRPMKPGIGTGRSIGLPPRARVTAAGLAVLPLLLAACGGSHTVAEHPTWADVEPILRADCLQCHGGSARTTGNVGDVVYRFDFFDVTPEICGESAATVDGSAFAAARAQLIANSISSDSASIRPRMPPAPSPALADWEWKTILRWTQAPAKGAAPPGNRPPTVRLVNSAPSADKRWTLSAVVEDPDGESAIGMLTIGDFKFNLDRPGAFVSEIDTSQWPAGDVSVQAIVCDGWTSATYTLGSIAVAHR